MNRLVLLAVLPIAVLAGCGGGGDSAAARGHEQAVQACTAAAGGGASSALAIVHAHQAARLDHGWQPLADALGQVGVLKQSLGSDLGAGEGDGTGAAALATVSQQCATLGVTVSASAPQTANPLSNLSP